ncbi:hypothetical protein BU14_0074s0070 [Porphyra umbilicalis]|uniref:Uncharacterized protein n=1 Tax=Porphyra umbilicalis TaxID=2786 RepID=A0A1X6PFN0_PORUM|nr:hypothetical protein BU14_0074s0070 [Porphyra umbilicalis]|eukprot:OSX79640.1 hypothetical protein BU14_0074s0070 [Porphyra umbilicalis]
MGAAWAAHVFGPHNSKRGPLPPGGPKLPRPSHREPPPFRTGSRRHHHSQPHCRPLRPAVAGGPRHGQRRHRWWVVGEQRARRPPGRRGRPRRRPRRRWRRPAVPPEARAEVAGAVGRHPPPPLRPSPPPVATWRRWHGAARSAPPAPAAGGGRGGRGRRRGRVGGVAAKGGGGGGSGVGGGGGGGGTSGRADRCHVRKNAQLP